MLSITSIVKIVQKFGTDALLIVVNYILGINWGTDFIYLFYLHIKIKWQLIKVSGSSVLLKFDSLYSLHSMSTR